MRELGPQVAAGGTSTVHRWGERAVLKLFTRAFQYAVDMEAERARAVHAAGVPSPAVLELVEIDGRRGIVYERVEGPLLFARLRDLGEQTVARQLAELHKSLASVHVEELPCYRDGLIAAEADESRRASLARALDALDAEDCLCHGDFHPGNVILAASGPIVIDWVNAQSAPHGFDVARSAVLMRFQGLDADTPAATRDARSRIAFAYLRARLDDLSVDPACVAFGGALSARALLRAQPDNAARTELEELVRREPVLASAG